MLRLRDTSLPGCSIPPGREVLKGNNPSVAGESSEVGEGVRERGMYVSRSCFQRPTQKTRESGFWDEEPKKNCVPLNFKGRLSVLAANFCYVAFHLNDDNYFY